jgi:predicted secreted protein
MNGTDPASLTLAVGEQRVIPLRALSTAGYRWSGAVSAADPPAIALEVRRGNPPPGAPPGQSAPEEAVVRGIRQGKALVRLEQRRPWEHTLAPAQVLEIKVEVAEPR